MMSSERMGSVALENLCPQSPELQLGTMSTADMFDTSWECSSDDDGGELHPDSGSSMLSQTLNDLQDDVNTSGTHQAQDTDLLEVNLEAFLGGDKGLLMYSADLPLDLSLLQDTSSVMSDASTSSSTITSYSIPESPGDFSAFLRDIDYLDEHHGVDFSSHASSARDFSLSCTDVDALAAGSQNSDVIESLEIKINCNENQSKLEEPSKCSSPVKKQKKAYRSPLKTASYLSHNISRSVDLVSASPKHQNHSPCSRTKISTKENKLTMRTKKLHDILDSSKNWSKLSGSEQWVIGEGLSHLLTQSLGVRERLDILKLLGCSSSEIAVSGDLDMTSILNDNSLEEVRHYLRHLERENSSAAKKSPKGRHGRHTSVHSPNRLIKEKKSEMQGKGLPSGEAISVPSPVKLSNGTDAHHCEGNTKGKSCFQKSKESLPWTKYQRKKGKLCVSGTAADQNYRSRKSYRQGLKEKRSGLFEQEVVVRLSDSTSPTTGTDSKQNLTDDDDDEDIDILG